MRPFARLLALLAPALLVPVAGAQTTGGLRVALDCQNTYCDTDFLRTEVAFVTFVRDPADADVQVLVTEQTNGSGGDTYTLRFLGRGRLDGVRDELTTATGATATDDDERRALARALAAGLVPFVARTGGLDRLRITATADASATPAAPERDPWNRWVFRLRGNGNFNGDANSRSRRLNFSTSAQRTTGRWKSEVSAFANPSRSAFDLDLDGDGANDTTIVNDQRSEGASASLVRSVGRRAALGVEAGASGATFSNTRLALRLEPGVEINLYPYSESTARLATLRYTVGLRHVAYRDSTIYFRTREALAEHALRLGLSFNQPWGTVGLSTTGRQYLNHPGQYALDGFGNVDVRLGRGLAVNGYLSVGLLRNQRELSAEGVSTEDVLLRRRSLATGYQYFGGIGLSYTFGSKFTGAVNPRFGEGGGIFFF